MSGKHQSEWYRLAEMLEATDRDGSGGRDGLRGFQIIKPNQMQTLKAGSPRQLLWAIENWVRPYLNRVRNGIEYDPKLHHMPVEPDWRNSRGRGNIQTRLLNPYGDEWQSDWHRNQKKRKAAIAARRARD